MTPTYRAALKVTLLLTTVWLGSTEARAADPADLIVTHASVYAEASGRAQALAVRGARITAVGADADVLRLRGPGTRVIDAGGRLVIPGINDAHMHWGPSAEGTTLELPSMDPSWAELLTHLAKAVAKAPRGSWIFGTFGGSVLDDARADRAALDTAAPEHPVLLNAWTGHGTLLNTSAMRKLGLPDDPPSAADGRVGRNRRGRFDGWLFEYPERRATATPAAVPRERAVRELKAWATEAARLGITSAQVMLSVPVEEFAALLAEARIGLRVRIINPVRPEQAITREQALAAYTRGSAFAEGSARRVRWHRVSSPIWRSCPRTSSRPPPTSCRPPPAC